MAINASKFIWFNGRFIPWEKATVHVMTHALHYGSSVGVRGRARLHRAEGRGDLPAQGAHAAAVRLRQGLSHPDPLSSPTTSTPPVATSLP